MNKCKISLTTGGIESRYLTYNDLRDLGVTNIIPAIVAPVIKIQGAPGVFMRRSYKFTSTDEVKRWFISHPEMHLVNEVRDLIFDIPTLDTNHVITQQSPPTFSWPPHKVEIKQKCDIKCCCNSLTECSSQTFLVYIMEHTPSEEILSDAFRECDSVECVINKVSETLSEILTGE